MSDNLKGLFGGGSDNDDDNRKRLSDFADRYTQGDPNDGYDDNEARENFQKVLQSAPPDVIQRAAHQTYQNLPESQRSELNQMLQDRQQGKNLVEIQRSGDRGVTGVTSSVGCSAAVAAIPTGAPPALAEESAISWAACLAAAMMTTRRRGSPLRARIPGPRPRAGSAASSAAPWAR
jgi:hypothetical protein